MLVTVTVIVTMTVTVTVTVTMTVTVAVTMTVIGAETNIPCDHSVSPYFTFWVSKLTALRHCSNPHFALQKKNGEQTRLFAEISSLCVSCVGNRHCFKSSCFSYPCTCVPCESIERLDNFYCKH
jgi:hypothetical protein